MQQEVSIPSPPYFEGRFSNGPYMNILRLSWKQTPPTLPMLVLGLVTPFFLLYRYRDC